MQLKVSNSKQTLSDNAAELDAAPHQHTLLDIDIAMSSGVHWCGAVRVVTLLSTFTLASAHACFDCKR